MALKGSHMWEETSKEEGEEHNYQASFKTPTMAHNNFTFMEMMKEDIQPGNKQ